MVIISFKHFLGILFRIRYIFFVSHLIYYNNHKIVMRNLFVNTSNHLMYLFVLSQKKNKFSPKYKQNSKWNEIVPHPPIFYINRIHLPNSIYSFIYKIVHTRTPKKSMTHFMKNNIVEYEKLSYILQKLQFSILVYY